jgi:transposase
MNHALNVLPNEIEVCHALIRAQQEQLRVKNEELISVKSELADVFEKLRHARLRFFGRSSEKFSPDQLGLCFNEAEAALPRELLESSALIVDDADSATPRPRTSRRSPLKSLPVGTPVVEIIHELPPEQRRCPHDGHELHVIGQEVSQQIDITLPKIELHRHIRLKYGCRCCEQGVHTAAMPPQCLPGTIATAGTAALIIVGKFVDHLPFYRQTFALNRLGLAVTRASLCDWAVKCGNLVVPLLNLLEETLLASEYLQIDETPLQVLNEPGRTADQLSYMWVRRTAIENKRIVLFHYSERRNAETAQQLLEGFSGRHIQHDGCASYNRVKGEYPITHLGCHAHARRPFADALKALPLTERRTSIAQEAIDFYKQLYRIEDQIRGLSPEERYRRRQAESVPILKQFEQWWQNKLPGASPTSVLGKALRYLADHWPLLIVYVNNGALEIDNNLVENAIRPFAIGRKNWLFNVTPKGAQASARLYSLIETAKANGLDPYFYLRHVFIALPQAKTLEDIEALLPWNIDPLSLIARSLPA